MGLLDAAKNVLSGELPGKAPETTADSRVERIDQCKAIWYQWKNELGTSDEIGGPFYVPLPSDVVASARSYDISNHIESFTYTKSMNEGAGSFSLTLANSFDWARWMRPGQWLCVYLSSNATGRARPRKCKLYLSSWRSPSGIFPPRSRAAASPRAQIS
jgi:hypothetical protein